MKDCEFDTHRWKKKTTKFSSWFNFLDISETGGSPPKVGLSLLSPSVYKMKVHLPQKLCQRKWLGIHGDLYVSEFTWTGMWLCLCAERDKQKRQSLTTFCRFHPASATYLKITKIEDSKHTSDISNTKVFLCSKRKIDQKYYIILLSEVRRNNVSRRIVLVSRRIRTGIDEYSNRLLFTTG